METGRPAGGRPPNSKSAAAADDGVSAGDWFRALQVPVLPVSVGPALVGGVIGSRLYDTFDGLVFLLVILSLVVVQVGANLHKGIVESADLGGKAERPRSPFVFDAGAVRRTGASAHALRRMMFACYGTGAGFGVLVVVLTGDWRLLALGGLGAFLAYSYSGPPLKLSYIGLGEISTFLAFGPVAVLGAALAQDPTLLDHGLSLAWNEPLSSGSFVVWVGITIGGLTAMISFARYFPSASEDRAKGKRTAVVRLGASASSVVYLLLALSSAAALSIAASAFKPLPLCGPPITSVSVGLGEWVLYLAALIAVVGAACAMLLRAGGRRGEAAVATTVALQVLACATVALVAAGIHYACA